MSEKYELIAKHPLLAPREWIKPPGELVQKYQLYYDGEPWGEPFVKADNMLQVVTPKIRERMIKMGFRVRLRWFIV